MICNYKMVVEKTQKQKEMNINRYINCKHLDTSMDGRIIPDWIYEDMVRLEPFAIIIFKQQNPHRRNSQWWPNYELYKKAKCINEAIEIGANINDLLHDYKRGNWKPKKPLPKEAQIPSYPDTLWDKIRQTMSYRADPETQKLIRRHRFIFIPYPELRQSPKKQLMILNEAFNKNISIEAAIRNSLNDGLAVSTRNNKANSLAASILVKKHISDSDMLNFLRNFNWDANISRQNVMREGVTHIYSKNMGILRDRNHPFPYLTPSTRDMPQVFELCARYLHDNVRIKLDGEEKKFPFTSVCLNRSYRGAPHVDGGNVGPSMIKGLGNYKDGNLLEFLDVEPSKHGAQLIKERGEKNPTHVVNIRDRYHFFNGKYVHSVSEINSLSKNEQPERYSIVWFTTNKYDKAPTDDLKWISRQTGVTQSNKQLEDLEKYWAVSRGMLPGSAGPLKKFGNPLIMRSRNVSKEGKRQDHVRLNILGILEKWDGSKWVTIHKADTDLKRERTCPKPKLEGMPSKRNVYDQKEGRIYIVKNGKLTALPDYQQPGVAKFQDLHSKLALFSNGSVRPLRGKNNEQEMKTSDLIRRD